MLEEQLGNSHKRVETVIELEKELVRYRKQVEEMSQVCVLLMFMENNSFSPPGHR